MKKLSMISLLSVFFVFAFSVAIMAQTLSGSQTRGNGSNAVLNCNGIQITKNMKITKVTGVNAGFWIVKGSATIKKYWNQNDSSAIGLTLSPGMYYVYPNLHNNGNSATVNLSLQ